MLKPTFGGFPKIKSGPQIEFWKKNVFLMLIIGWVRLSKG